MSSYSTTNESERGTWPNKLEYHLSLFSYVLGIITFWRFPYLAYENGGAAFLYAFLLLHIFIGIPVIFLEMAWGQYGNQSPAQAFKLVPAMQGVGVCMIFLACVCLLYFGVSSYYFLLYLISSFSDPLPWTTCENSWNTASCIDPACNLKNSNCSSSSPQPVTPAVEYWHHNFFNDNICTYFFDGSEQLLGPASNFLVSPLTTFACFVAGRLVISLLALANNVRLTGKVAYLLSTVSFVVMLILLVRCLTLPGALFGQQFLFVPSLDDFLQPKVWKDACGQVFLSIMASTGGLITWSSYNRFYNKYHYDATMLILIIPIFSIFPAVAVYGVLGHLAEVSQVPVNQLFNTEPGSILPLIAYSEALSQMWGDVLPWSIVVFSVLFLSSTSSLFSCLECLLSSLSDVFPLFRRSAIRIVTLLLLLLSTIVVYYGIPCYIQGTGSQIIDFFDDFSLPLCLMFVGFFNMLFVFYAFGYNLLYTNTKAMTGSRCLGSHFWSFVWGGFTPLVILACFVYTVYGIIREPSTRSDAAEEFAWSFIAGLVLVGFVVILFFLVTLIRILMTPGSCKEKFRIAFTPLMTRMSGNGDGIVSHNNGDVFMSEYTSHREPRMEVFYDEDIVTTV